MQRSGAAPEAVSVTPSAVDIDGVANVTDLLTRRLAAAPDHIAFDVRESPSLEAPWARISTREFADTVRQLAKGLIASGVAAGDTVVIMAPTQYHWAVVDHAALFAGAIVVPVYDTAAPAQLRAILADARPTVVFVGTAALIDTIRTAADPLDPDVWVLPSAGAADPATDVHPRALSRLGELGASVTDAELDARRTQATLDDVATIVYTSGTTGDPKGALITHRNLVGQVLNTAAAYSEVVRETGNTILFLPLTHVLGRALQLICIANGMRVAHLSDPKEVVRALAILRPTFLVVVPRVLEKIQGAAESAAREKRLTRVWEAAQRTAEEWGAALERGDREPGARAATALRVRHALFDRVFYRRLRAVMGGRVDYLLSGAATLRPELARFFRGIGVPVIEGYGLTETTAPLTGGRPGSLVAGSVGPPLPGNEVKISAAGEVLARGVGVFAGYRNDAHNVGAFVDGYFRTGDLGALGADGALTLRGRLKHVIVTSTGRTVSPEGWEQAVERHPLVAHAALIGTDRPYLTALLVIDEEAALQWRADHPDAVDSAARPGAAPSGEPLTVCDHPGLRAEIAEAVTAANALVPPAEHVRSWDAVGIAADRTAAFVTPTMKLKRQALLEAGSAIIDRLYR